MSSYINIPSSFQNQKSKIQRKSSFHTRTYLQLPPFSQARSPKSNRRSSSSRMMDANQPHPHYPPSTLFSPLRDGRKVDRILRNDPVPPPHKHFSHPRVKEHLSASPFAIHTYQPNQSNLSKLFSPHLQPSHSIFVIYIKQQK